MSNFKKGTKRAYKFAAELLAGGRKAHKVLRKALKSLGNVNIRGHLFGLVSPFLIAGWGIYSNLMG